jgi:hypothetical protein
LRVIYLSYICAPGIYADGAKRFAETYQKYPAGTEHTLITVNTNGGLTPEVETHFDKMRSYQHNTWTGGWDIGAHQHVANSRTPDTWLMCFSSWAYFDRPGWLAAFVEAREKYGKGLYGSTASKEDHLHLRGTGFFVPAEAIQKCPIGVNCRAESQEWEHGPENFTLWCMKNGFPPRLVAPSGVYEPAQWRELSNGFREGNQSDIWTRDKHTLIYDLAAPEARAILTRTANGQ